ncbi:hypothetical protein H4R35_006210, partial [Dimargaris xerosporica]
MLNLKEDYYSPSSSMDRTIYSQRFQQLIDDGMLFPEAYEVLKFHECREKCLVVELMDIFLEFEQVLQDEQLDELYQLAGNALQALLDESRPGDIHEILRLYLQLGDATVEDSGVNSGFIEYHEASDEYLRSHFALMYMIRAGQSAMAVVILADMDEIIHRDQLDLDELGSSETSSYLAGTMKSGYEALRRNVIKVALVQQEQVEDALANQHWS